MRNQKGFTLIELIIVIVVLGILAVTAAPQFINFSSDARTSALKGMEGSIKGAMQLTYSKAAVEGVETDSTATVSVKGTDVDLVFGYPDASAAGIIEAVDAGFATDLSNDWVYAVVSGTPNTVVMAQSSSVTASDPFATSDITGSGCYLTYTAASATTATPPVISPATIAVSDQSGC
ncbi:type II secretion system protein [Idiomarina sp. 29L]|uniref:type II secretion system protein n=1 Tax=Idiomarina sp. 29L TaxID=2508877 RepID=UPI0010123C61|nr:prepilin-type N-terminal cleavage/methylation domain-containing protein [Idiomarina sp. 29L]RXS43185.1 type II secretion system protein [Idiomarina sp. 29L]